MRKDELLYLHQLLTMVRSEYERRDDVLPGSCESYDELSVSPVAAYEQKQKHRTAVLSLAAALAACSADQVDSVERGNRQSIRS